MTTATAAGADRSRQRHTFGAATDPQRQYDHEVIEVARVVRVVKGGRRFRFRASVIVGDRAGTVGFGVGKSRDVQSAIQKAEDRATKNVVKIPLQEGTIAHATRAKFKGAHVLLRPARPGTGIIAGSTVRIVADLVGIQDLVAKRYGSTNLANNAQATLRALQLLRSVPAGHSVQKKSTLVKSKTATK
ncbi:30S ribosomal protein S5 [Patescibacteria group bacterium]|nr:30S ribosomal protein S5 [Patescibacteria group bacterium]